MKNLDLGAVVHAFNLIPGKAEVVGSLSMRPTWSIEQDLEQLSLGSEEQKAGEDLSDKGSHVLALVSSSTWQLWSCGSGFSIKDRRQR